MNREPAIALPKGIVHTRTLINSLAKEKRINLLSKTPLWQEAEVQCKPFKGSISYSRENIEIEFRIHIGRVLDTYLVEETLQDLPVPVNFEYSLEPNALVTIVGNLAVTPVTEKVEVTTFFTNTMLIALMATQTLLVNQVFEVNTVEKFAETTISSHPIFPYPSEPWNFSEIAQKILLQE